jgi:hypothetical protein
MLAKHNHTVNSIKNFLPEKTKTKTHKILTKYNVPPDILPVTNDYKIPQLFSVKLIASPN